MEGPEHESVRLELLLALLLAHTSQAVIALDSENRIVHLRSRSDRQVPDEHHAFLAKPFTPRGLAAAIRELLDRK